MTLDPYALTTHDGKTVDEITHQALLAAEEILGYELTITQGSYHKGVSASAGTHDGGGVVDLAPFDWANKVRALRSVGFAAWHRPALPGTWPEHIHAVLIGNKKLSPSAMRQVLDFQAGRNGLADHGRDPDTFHPGVVFEMPKPPAKPKVKPIDKPRTRIFAVNMHAPGMDDAPRMERALARIRKQNGTVFVWAEGNLPMARQVREHPNWGLHRAQPNQIPGHPPSTSGNAVGWWKPVWRRVEASDLPVQVTGRVLTMAGLVLEHRRTGYVLPVLSIHNPARAGKGQMSQDDRNACIEAELDWVQGMTAKHGRALVAGDFNQPGALLSHLGRGAGHEVDEMYGRAITFSSAQVHEGFVPVITDHPAVSVLIKV